MAETKKSSTPAAEKIVKFDSKDIEDNKAMAILAYIIFFIPMIAAPNSPFAKFHANQGLVLFWAGLVSYVAMIILGFLTLGLTFLLMPLLWIGMLVLAILGIVNAASGEAKELPIIGSMKLYK